MRQRKTIGITLDLTRIPESGQFVLEDLIVTEPVRVDHCDVCNSGVVGAYRICDGRAMCGLCCAIHEEKLSVAAIGRLLQEYAKPCTFCGDRDMQKHFDHINMFTKAGCIGWMVEKGHNSDDILAEINKCQVVCIKCHKKVTSHERAAGFMVKKGQLNALKRAGHDISVQSASLMAEYSAFMGPIYEGLRGGRGGAGLGIFAVRA
jgi:hypothetical protein